MKAHIQQTKKPIFIILLVFACTFLITCEKIDRDNPWDADADISPADWAPYNLKIDQVSITERKLTWKYGDHNIEGFKIDRKKGDGEWNEAFITLGKDARSWNDAAIVPDASLTYSYRAYAYAGGNESSKRQIIFYTFFECKNNVTFIYKDQQVTYGTVLHNDLCWMDRNLGASRVPTSSTDFLYSDDLFQWGRLDDGHQNRTSGTISTLSNTDVPGHGNFITVDDGPWDWRSPQNNNFWQGTSGINNPCPPDWRLPTETELNTERQSWSSNNSSGAYASSLKWPVGGFRFDDGTLYNVGSYGFVWSSSVSGAAASYLLFDSGYANMYSLYRALGMSVRCVRD